MGMSERGVECARVVGNVRARWGMSKLLKLVANSPWVNTRCSFKFDSF